jgi:predicted DNA-binding transcriptional regulator AlpA
MAIYVLGQDDPLLDANEMAAAEGVSRPCWEKWRQRGLVPKPIYVGRKPYWRPRDRREQLLKQLAG